MEEAGGRGLTHRADNHHLCRRTAGSYNTPPTPPTNVAAPQGSRATCVRAPATILQQPFNRSR